MPGFALDADLAAHQLDEPLTDGQPEAGAAEPAGGRASACVERLEQPRLRGRVDADAGVA